MARTDRIYHAVITDRAAGAVVAYMPTGGRAEVWADGKHDVARSGFAPIGSGKITVIDLRHECVIRWPPSDGSGRIPPPPTCYGTGVAVQAVLGCPPYTASSSERVLRGSYAGRAAIDVRSKVAWSTEDEDVSKTINLYLDPNTLLPMVRVTIGTTNGGHFRQVETFATSFVDRRSLPKDFFDPKSIGYRRLEAALPVDGHT